MQFFAISAAIALLATLGSAAPAKIEARNSCWVSVTFEGATPEAQFTQSVPTNVEFSISTFFYVPLLAPLIVSAHETFLTGLIDNPLSISHIQVGSPYGGCSTDCTFYGIDGSVTQIYGAGFSDVGPPQTQVSGYCYATY